MLKPQSETIKFPMLERATSRWFFCEFESKSKYRNTLIKVIHDDKPVDINSLITDNERLYNQICVAIEVYATRHWGSINKKAALQTISESELMEG